MEGKKAPTARAPTARAPTDVLEWDLKAQPKPLVIKKYVFIQKADYKFSAINPLGRDQDFSLKNREPDGPAPSFLDPGGWSKTTAVSLYFIFPGICTLSLPEIKNSLDAYQQANGSRKYEALVSVTAISPAAAAGITDGENDAFSPSRTKAPNPFQTQQLLEDPLLYLIHRTCAWWQQLLLCVLAKAALSNAE
ncbi:hypothetical protein STEG23_001849 [Scotinomys teguina]